MAQESKYWLFDVSEFMKSENGF